MTTKTTIEPINISSNVRLQQMGNIQMEETIKLFKEQKYHDRCTGIAIVREYEFYTISTAVKG